MITNNELMKAYEDDFRRLRSLSIEERKLLMQKYSKNQLIAMARLLYTEDVIAMLRKKTKVEIGQSISNYLSSVERARTMRGY